MQTQRTAGPKLGQQRRTSATAQYQSSVSPKSKPSDSRMLAGAVKSLNSHLEQKMFRKFNILVDQPLNKQMQLHLSIIQSEINVFLVDHRVTNANIKILEDKITKKIKERDRQTLRSSTNCANYEEDKEIKNAKNKAPHTRSLDNLIAQQYNSVDVGNTKSLMMVNSNIRKTQESVQGQRMQNVKGSLSSINPGYEICVGGDQVQSKIFAGSKNDTAGKRNRSLNNDDDVIIQASEFGNTFQGEDLSKRLHQNHSIINVHDSRNYNMPFPTISNASVALANYNVLQNEKVKRDFSQDKWHKMVKFNEALNQKEELDKAKHQREEHKMVNEFIQAQIHEKKRAQQAIFQSKAQHQNDVMKDVHQFRAEQARTKQKEETKKRHDREMLIQEMNRKKHQMWEEQKNNTQMEAEAVERVANQNKDKLAAERQAAIDKFESLKQAGEKQLEDKKNRLASQKARDKEMDRLYMDSHMRNHDIYLTKKILDYKKRIGLNEERAKISKSIGSRITNFQDVGKEKLVQVNIQKNEQKERQKFLSIQILAPEKKLADQIKLRAILGQQVDRKQLDVKSQKFMESHFARKLQQDEINHKKDQNDKKTDIFEKKKDYNRILAGQLIEKTQRRNPVLMNTHEQMFNNKYLADIEMQKSQIMKNLVMKQPTTMKAAYQAQFNSENLDRRVTSVSPRTNKSKDCGF